MPTRSQRKFVSKGFSSADAKTLSYVFDVVYANYPNDSEIESAIIEAISAMAAAGARSPEKLALYAGYRADVVRSSMQHRFRA